MNEIVNTKAFAGKDEAELSPQQAPLRNFFREPFTRVPAPYIGKIADGQKAAAPALHLLAYKTSKGGSFVLNIIDVVWRQKLMGKHLFENGLKHLKAKGVLVRHQPNHRDFASETLSPVQEGCYCVSINDAVILRSPSATVAFILAANVSPTPRTPAEIAAKIGIKSRDTTRKVLTECIKLGAVEVFHDACGKAWVCRVGEAHQQGVTKNRGAINRVTKNRGTQRNKKEEQRIREQDKKTEHTYVAANASVHLLCLHDWREHDAVQELTRNGHVDLWIEAPETSSSEVAALIQMHGAAPPAHLISQQGVKQICALAAVAAEYHDGEVDFETALGGVCNRIACEINAGKTIRSLAFIALPILKAAHYDGDWATHYPSSRLGSDLSKWLTWADGVLIPALNRVRVATDNHALTSTPQLEALAELFREHGQDRIEAACRGASIEKDEKVCGWRYITQFLQPVPRVRSR